MICELCAGSNPDGALQCMHCSSLLPPPRPAEGGAASAPPGSADRALESLLRKMAEIPSPATVPAVGMGPGARLGPRYEIVKLLGKGGMGAVYLAHDHELSRRVAVKLIAPHLSMESWVVERFKREIHLSSIVTHPNVLRVFDLGEHEGVKFLTMQYVEGETLADLIRREGPLPLDSALSLFRQICAGVCAAHAKGVVHRDLKPQNVLVDGERNVYVTDFGLATSQEVSALTQTGALLGTPHYMSPEQVKGEPSDARSDVFSAGVILYEMLSGALPYEGESAYAVMIARTRGPPRPIADRKADVPKGLQRVLDGCLAREAADRYASMDEVLRELDGSTVAAGGRRWRTRWRALRRSVSWRWAAAAAALVVAAAAPAVVSRLARKPAAPAGVRTVLIADFDNRTGEDVFNGTLEPAVSLALEGASFITTYPRAGARKTADQLKLEGDGLSERRARLVAQREGLGVVAAGYVEKSGSGYQLGIRVVDAFTGQKVTEARVDAADRSATLAAITELAAKVREALGDVTPAGVQLKEGETFSAASLEAAHEYGVANDLALFQGKFDEARVHYLEAIRLDPGMGRAYNGLAVIEGNRNRHAEAEKYFDKALQNVDRMTERERLRTRGLWYFVRRDTAKSIEAFEALVQKYPADSAGLMNLALAHSMKGDFSRALDLGRRAVAIYPRSVTHRSNVGYYAMYAGDFASAIEEQKRSLELNPGFEAASIGLALAQIAAGRPDDARKTWGALEATGAAGSSAAAEGLADLAVLEGRFRDAKGILEEGIERDLAAGDPDAAARKMVISAELHLARGELALASDAAERALRTTNVDFAQFLAGLVLAQAGKDKRARALADAFDERWEPDPKMFAELLRGAAHLQRREHSQAIERFRAGLGRHDAWIARSLLGRAYLQAGALEQARDELELCEKRRGEATDLFVESVPTYRFYGPVQYHLARAREVLRSPAAADAYRAFLALKKGDEDPLVADAMKRLAALGKG
jgi:tetratricopeptide (TPR) repeat protein/predicted Ser/Thr protein kinase